MATQENRREEAGKNEDGVPWERQLVEKLVLSATREQTRARRWNLFFKFLILGYFIALLVFAFWGDGLTEAEAHLEDHAAVIRINDVIAPDEQGISADQVIKGLKKAYKNDKVKGIILEINSPGGSPVQSARIWSSVRELREEHDKIPVYAVIGDVGASGAYYVASAADEIYANESSIVGSIGVRMGEFGFVDTIEKLGIERRVMTAGDRKTALDPFLPLHEDDKAHAEKMLDEVHAQFIDAVKQGRGEKLVDNEEIFSGLFWSGKTASELGLIDGFGDSHYVAGELLKVEKKVDYTYEENALDRLLRRFGVGVGEALARYSVESSLQIR
ncbi:MAG: signal peptide peptidase SppA [Sedimenticolaceae bacterium]|nr:signal peptide peptidase SppA [Sedimenticolaceae bacterium]